MMSDAPAPAKRRPTFTYPRPKQGEHEVLISPGFGAGWSSWVYGPREAVIFALTDRKMIAAVKKARRYGLAIPEAAVGDFVARFEDAFPGQHFYAGGSRDLDVCVVSGPFVVKEYDGSETIQHVSTIDFIDLDREG